MANITVSTSSNLDDAANLALGNSENITIDSGAVLTINSDNRWSQQAAVPELLTISSATGGEYLIDGRDVWWMAYDAATGNVPTLGTAGVQNCTGGTSGATGEFLGIWTALGVSPSTAGGAMPAAGFIKFRSKVGTFQDNETVTLPGGATIVVNSATGGERGWISVVMESIATSAITVPRLGAGRSRGDWFYLGTTSGSAGQTFQFPVADICFALDIETGSGTGVYEKWLLATDGNNSRWAGLSIGTVTGITRSGSTATLTTSAAHNQLVGSTITVEGATQAEYNGTFVVVSVPTTTTLTYAVTGTPATPATGTISAFVQWIPTDSRGKYFGCTTAGVITLAKRGTKPAGFLPPSGCLVRIPNVLLGQSVSPYTALSVNATIGSRPEFVTTSNGVIDMEFVHSSWNMNFVNAYSVDLENIFAAERINVTEAVTPISINNVAMAPYNAATIQGLSIDTCLAGGSVSGVRATRLNPASTNQSAHSFSDCVGFTVSDCRFESFLSNTTAQRTTGDSRTVFQRCTDFDVTDLTSVGLGVYAISCSRFTFDGVRYIDQLNGSTPSVTAHNAVTVQTVCNDITFTDVGWGEGLTNVQSYNYMFTVSQGCLNIRIRECGTDATPVDFGSANACQGLLSAAYCIDSRVNNCHTVNARTQTVSTGNETKGLYITNISGDYADAGNPTGEDGIYLSQRKALSSTNSTGTVGMPLEGIFTSDTAGILQFRANEGTATSAGEIIVAGTPLPLFDGGGGCNLGVVGQSLILGTRYAILGYTAFTNSSPTLTGTNTGNLTMEFRTDTGSGWSAWTSLTGANLNAVSISPTAGFFIQVRATCAVGDPTNNLKRVDIAMTTTLTDSRAKHPYAYVPAGFSNAESGSNLSVWNDGSSALVASAASASATVPWTTDYSSVYHLRKAGWSAYEVTRTITEGVTSSNVVLATQSDYATIPDTDPGALGITITNHGASPVSWQSKNWSITITTTNDALTAAQVANWVNYNVSQLATWNGFNGTAWPEMIQPDGTLFKSVRGRLIGSAGAALKGVRVVRNDGTTPVFGFTTMMADDGTLYTVPQIHAISLPALADGTRVRIYNSTSTTEIANAVVSGGAGYSLTLVEGTDYTAGDTIRWIAFLADGDTYYYPQAGSFTATSGAYSFGDAQTLWAAPNAVGLDWTTVTECTTDYVGIEVEVTDPDDIGYKSRYAIFVTGSMSTADGIRNWITLTGTPVITWVTAASTIVDTAIASVAIKNTKVASILRVTDAFAFNWSDGVDDIDAVAGASIVWKNSLDVAVVNNPDITTIKNLVEADEYHTPTTVEKRLKGTATVLLTKNHTGTPLTSLEVTE